MIMSAPNLSKYLDRNEGWCYLGVVLSAGILTAISERLDPSLMQVYFGQIPTYLLWVVLAVVGGLLLGYLKQYQLSLYSRHYKGLVIAVALAGLFGLIIVGVEHLAPLGRNINVPFPYSLAFYPAITFYVEIIFHIIPLALLLFLARNLLNRSKLTDKIWIVLLIVALLEPLFQTIVSDNQGYSTALTAYIALHIFLINLTQLFLFRKYDFLSMILFRLMYYLLWHVLWGHLRLEILF